MSSAGAGGSEDAEGKKKGIGKYVTRMKTILKKRQSISGASVVSGSDVGSPTSPTVAAKTTPTITTPLTAPVVAPVVAPAPPAKDKAASPTTTTKAKAPVGRAGDPFNHEKAKALFQKYGIDLDLSEWPLLSREPGERIEKPIRMRIHRTCHHCQTTFGVEKTCISCGHGRCKKCPRYPSKKPKEKGKEVVSGTPEKPKQKHQLTIPSRSGGQDLVRKNIRQRVHRTCHKCSAEFTRGEKICVNCNHVRCKKCPRDPAKLKKYPDGYPGDAEPEPGKPPRAFKKIRRRVRWTCHSCLALYSEGSKICVSCSHERCVACIRDPLKKVKPPPDPEVVRSVAEKLLKMSLASADYSSSA